MDNIFSKRKKKRRLIDSLRPSKSDPFPIQEGRFSFGGLKDSFYYTDWAEGSYLDDNKSKEVLSLSFNFKYLKYFIVFTFLAFVILIFRSFWLQISRNDYYTLLSESNRLRIESIEPKRGIIYTADMKALVRNKANFVLYLQPLKLPKNELLRDNLLRQISNIIGAKSTNHIDNLSVDNINNTSVKSLELISDDDIFYKIKNSLAKIKLGSLASYQPVLVKDNIDYDTAMLLFLHLKNWPGVYLTTKIRREYLLPSASSSPEVLGLSSFSHILGYTGKINQLELEKLGHNYSPIDYVGKMGIEYTWEKELKGKPGQKDIEVDALGRQKKIINEIPAIDGYNLQLAIQSDLQTEVEKITKSYLQKDNLRRATVVVMNPNNGEIMSLLSLPAYNNNLFAQGISQEKYNDFLHNPDKPLFNRAISGEFPSGSTIKPIFAAAALQDGIITSKTSVLSTGGIRIGQWFFPDWKLGGHGRTNVRKALAWSVNTFFYYIGGGFGNFKGLGLDALVKYAHLFGLGSKTGVDLPGERAGFVPTAAWKKRVKKESWYIGDTYHFSIGQGDVLVTPLQVANYISAIANGGTLYRPHLVTNILNTDNSVVKKISPEIIRRGFIDKNNLKIVRLGMRDAVTYGSARSLKFLPVEVAGKTGTAQWSSKKLPHAWFVAFAPYKKAKLVIVVLVEEGGEGSAVAAPIAKDILNWYFTKYPEADNK